ncbi:MAG: hypothetical protein LQ351_002540 [Letrouitia transgressa]|nr:MAG: hypothetical protein LQ351_002540 [Letrouitia transgressa]
MDEPKSRSSTSKASRLWRYRYLLVAFWIVVLIVFLGRPLERLPSLNRTTSVDLSGKVSDTVGKLKEEQGKEDEEEVEGSTGEGNGTVVEVEAGTEPALESEPSATAISESTPTASEEAASSTPEGGGNGEEPGVEQAAEAQNTSGSIATSTVPELATSSPAT